MTAERVSTSTVGGGAAGGNSGGGHGGAGGLGGATPAGSVGTAYGDQSVVLVDQLVPSEAGSVGAPAASAGRGGGAIQLGGDRVIVGGKVSVAGSSGKPGIFITPDCAVTSPPESVKPNTGRAGFGGGSGGAIVLVGRVVDLTGGTVLANGGSGTDGTAGGGGGGGSGIVKVIAPVFRGTVNVGGGLGGTNLCPGDPGLADGGSGQSLAIVRSGEPVSFAAPPGRLWNGTGFDVMVNAAAPDLPGHPNFVVVTCSSWRPPQASESDNENYGIDMPTTNSLASPCGGGARADRAGIAPDPSGNTDEESVILELGRTLITGEETLPGGTAIRPPTMHEGFSGVYTVAVKAGKTGSHANNCFDPLDPLFGPVNDAADCSLERLPEKPDMTVAIDNTPPKLEAPTLPGVEAPTDPSVDYGRTKSQDVNLEINAPDEMARTGHIIDGDGLVRIIGLGDPKLANFSGTDQIECSDDGTTFRACALGSQRYHLTDGSGLKTIYVQAFDRAGNGGGGVKSVTVELDNTPPTSEALVISTDVGLNGWYVESPTFRIENFADGGSAPPKTGRFKYWMGSGEPTSCDEKHCHYAPLLSDGVHQFHWQAIDAIGNEEPVRTLEVKVDTHRPDSRLYSAPAVPDGANNWFVTAPWVVVSVVDPTGGSGLVNAATDPSQTAGVTYQVTSNGFVGALHEHIKPRDFVPFQLGAGSHDVCWQVTDVAGKQDFAIFGTQCRHYEVDIADPVTTLTPTATAGDNGWLTSFVPVAASASDSGSTVDPNFDPTYFDLCAPVPAVDDPKSPSGTCVSIDNGPFHAYFSPFTFGEGLHNARAYSIDVAGRKSTTIELPLKVDKSHPVTSIRTVPAEPTANGWFRTNPLVVLRAVDGDQNAGTRLVRYRVDGGSWITYKEPFSIAEGIHRVDYQTLDLSGPVNDEAPRTLTLGVDLTPPVAKALNSTPLLWSRLLVSLGLQPATSKLNFQITENVTKTGGLVTENQTKKVQVFVIVYDELGHAVRRIDGGVRTVTAGVPYLGSVDWNGKDQTLLGLVGIGIYHFRVVAIDEAGNRTQSGESKPLQIKLL